MSSAAPGRGPRIGVAWLAAAAIGVFVVIIAINALRPSPQQPASIPSAPPSSAPPSPVATASAPAVKPDSQHGLIVATGNMRTEDDERGLQQPSLFMLTPTSSYSVSPDGKRIALVRTSQTGQQLVTFTTARPNDVTTVVDFAGSGELASRVIWAGDGSDNLLFDAEKQTSGQGGGNAIWEYSALQSADLVTRNVREVVRIAGQNTKLWPLAWLPGRQVVGALEVRQLRPIVNYVTVRNGTLERIALSPSPNGDSFSAANPRPVAVPLGLERWYPAVKP